LFLSCADKPVKNSLALLGNEAFAVYIYYRKIYIPIFKDQEDNHEGITLVRGFSLSWQLCFTLRFGLFFCVYSVCFGGFHAGSQIHVKLFLSIHKSV